MQNLLDALIASTAYAVIATETEGKITVFNRAAEQLLGYDAAQVLGKATPALFHLPEEVEARAHSLSISLGRPVAPGFEAFVAETLATGAPDERKWTYVRGDGVKVPVLLSITALRDEHNDQLTGFLGIARDVSELEVARQAVEIQESRMRAVFEANLDGAFVVNELGVILDCNISAEKLTLYPRAELIGKNINKLMPPEIAAEHTGYIQRYCETGDGRVIGRVREVQVVRRNGTVFPADLTVVEAGVAENQQHIFAGTLHDLTAQKAVVDERALLSEIINETPDFIGAADLQGQISFLNRAAYDLLGWAPDTPLKDKSVSLVHPRWAAERVRTLAIPEAQKTGQWTGENALLGRDGAEIPVSQVVLLHKDESGRPTHLSTVMRDLRKEQATQNLMRKTMFHVPGVIFALNVSNCGAASFPFASPAVERLFGISTSEAQESAERFFGRVHEEDVERFQTHMQESADQRELWKDEFRYRHPDGRLRWYSWQAQPDVHPDGSVTWHGYSADITDVVHSNDKLRRALADAESASKVKAEFLATMSHEIRTPLNGVIAMADLLAETHLDDEQIEFVQTIRSSGDSLLLLINDILDFTKMEAGKLVLENVEFSPAQLVEEVKRLFAENAARKFVTLRCSCNLSDDIHTLGDPERIRQVLLNLVSNAVKFTHEGEVHIDATLESGPEYYHGGALILQVKDSGIGMTADHVARLGQAFVQADSSTTRRYSGTGLGVSIVYQLVQLMKGQIEVDTELGSGSTFTVTIPTRVVRASSPSLNPSLFPGAAPGRLPGLRRVLVADDNPTNRRVVELVLKNLAQEVDLVENGALAVEHFTSQHYDLILLDGNMPELGGLEAARIIREKEQRMGKERTPIVALTASALPGDRERFLHAGMDDYLTKPLRLRALAEILCRLNETTGESL